MHPYDTVLSRWSHSGTYSVPTAVKNKGSKSDELFVKRRVPWLANKQEGLARIPIKIHLFALCILMVSILIKNSYNTLVIK